MRRVIVLGVVAAVIVTGCTSDAPPEPRVAEVSVEDVGQFEFPLNRYLDVGGPDSDVVARAYQVLFADCMSRFGFTVEPPPAGSSTVEPRSRRYGLVDLDEARQYGYRHPLAAEDSQGGEPAQPRSEAYYAVATGELTHDHNGLAIPEGGCFGEAQRILDEGAPVVENVMFGQSLVIQAGRRSEQDSRVVAAFEAWSECMARAGYNYADPWEANDDPAFGGPVVTSAEIAVATADVTCKEEVNLVNIWAAVEVAYQEQIIEENAEALGELLELLETRRRNAAAIVAAHG